MATLTPKVREDLLHSLSQVMGFYGKKLSPESTVFWNKFLDRHDPVDLKNALEEYTATGKYAPKPVDIANIIEKRTGAKRIRSTLPAPELFETNCPPDIARAWMWFIGQTAKGSQLESLFSSDSKISIEQQEAYLVTVNTEARKYNNPDAVPAEYRIPELWR